MKKKTLAAYPMHEVPPPRTLRDVRKIITADRTKIEGTDTLIINCFKYQKGKVVPWLRTFCQESDFITLSLEDAKWQTGSFAYVTGGYWTDYYKCITPSAAMPQDRDIITSFFKDWRQRNKSGRDDTGYDFEDYINSYQADLRDRKRAEKHRKKLEAIDRRMEKFKELPPDYPEFIEKTVFDDYNYFFYSRKKKRAYCTRCGHNFLMTPDGGLRGKKVPVSSKYGYLRHNRDVICPFCNKLTKAKSEGISRQSLLEVNWSVCVQADGNDVLTRYIRHTKDYRKDYRNPVIKSSELYRTIHTSDSQEDYEWSWYPGTGETRWRDPVNHGWSWNPSAFVLPRSTTLYNLDFDFLKTTCMRYSCIDLYVSKLLPEEEYISAWVIDQFFNFYHRYPYIEQLLKIGWFRLVRQLMHDSHSRDRKEFKPGRNIYEICGITREQFLTLKAVCNNPDINYLTILRHAEMRNIRLNTQELEELHTITSNNDSDIDGYLNTMRYSTLHKITKYIRRQHIEYASDYFDYLVWIQELGYDMKNSFNLFPKNFIQKHDETSEEYIKSKDALYQKALSKFNKELKGMKEIPINMHVGGLFIRPPFIADELKKEGECLHHCVGTYVQSVIEKKTQIFFIRRMEEPDIPYYTLEWKNNKVVQCRGFKNCDPTPEVKAFVEIFEKQIKRTSKRKAKMA